jgi:hypothetical protein
MPRGQRGGRGGRGKKNGEAPAAVAETSGSQEASRNHNVGERRESMRNALNSVYELDQEIAGIIEEHVKPLREDKSEIMTSLRERFNLPAKIFRARYYAYRAEREAADSSDEITQDAIRELFEVCPVTGQGSFAEALGTTVPPPPAAPAPKPPKTSAPKLTEDPEEAWAQGEAARKAGQTLASCQYVGEAQKRLRGRWEEGWESADFEIKRASGRGNEAPAQH